MAVIYNRIAMKARRCELRKNETCAEDILWEHLKGRRLMGLKFRRQYSIGAFVVDFYCPSQKLAIELDGPIHERKAVYDRYRENRIKELRIKLLRFKNAEVKKNLRGVLKEIAAAARCPA
jgi:very-short-patch-repair endonuclease